MLFLPSSEYNAGSNRSKINDTGTGGFTLNYEGLARICFPSQLTLFCSYALMRVVECVKECVKGVCEDK